MRKLWYVSTAPPSTMAGVVVWRARPHLEPPQTMTDRTRPIWGLPGAEGTRDRTPVAAWGLLRRRLPPVAALVVLASLAAAGCAGASSASSAAAASSPGESVGHRPGGASTTATLVGARCKDGDGHCSCRRPGDNHPENPLPDADHKRFEIRLGNEDGGDAVLDSPTLGRFSAGASESCFYIDVLPGTHHMLTFTAREGRPTAGLSPTMRIAEYGPKGPYW